MIIKSLEIWGCGSCLSLPTTVNTTSAFWQIFLQQQHALDQAQVHHYQSCTFFLIRSTSIKINTFRQVDIVVLIHYWGH